MQITRDCIPHGAKMLGVAAAEILRRADILWWREFREEVIVSGTIKWTFAVYGRLADYPRLMNVVILERVIEDTVRKRVAVMMAIRAASAALRDFGGEDLFAARNLLGLSLSRRLRQRVWQEPRLILRPKNL